MAKKEGFGFDYDERTEVPTYEEVSTTMPQFVKNIADKSPIKPKKHHVILIASLLIVALLAFGGYMTVKKVGVETVSAPFGAMTGYIVNDVNYSDQSLYGAEIEGIPIDLIKEESDLIKKLTDELTDELTNTCEEEKRQVRVDTKQEKENQCQEEIQDYKDAYEEEIQDLEDEVDSWKNKYQDCKDSSN